LNNRIFVRHAATSLPVTGLVVDNQEDTLFERLHLYTALQQTPYEGSVCH